MNLSDGLIVHPGDIGSLVEYPERDNGECKYGSSMLKMAPEGSLLISQSHMGMYATIDDVATYGAKIRGGIRVFDIDIFGGELVVADRMNVIIPDRTNSR